MSRRIEITAEFDFGDRVEFQSGRSTMIGIVTGIEVHVSSFGSHELYIGYCVQRTIKGRLRRFYPVARTMRLIAPATTEAQS